MSKEIVNRVQKSGIITIDMDDIELPKKILELDIKCWLSEGLFFCLLYTSPSPRD